jgi:Ca2+-binding EF-hand superfamily protein
VVSGFLLILSLVLCPEEAAGPGSLAEELASKAAAAIERAWRGRPEWGDMLISVLKGEDPGAGASWFKPREDRRGWDWLRERFDADADGRISREELGAAGEHFERLDRDGDNAIAPNDFAIRAKSSGNAEAAEAVFSAFDADQNDRVSWDELSWFFQRADASKRGFLSRADLAQALQTAASPWVSRHGSREDAGESAARPPSRWTNLERFLAKELGSFGEGPAVGAPAPDFELRSLREGETLRLTSLLADRLPGPLPGAKGKRPVVLVFGSFT